jgi:hypothetical protein
MLRLCQMPEANWCNIETSAGVYSAAALAKLDSIITFQRQNKASVYMGLYGTPTFYASSAAHPTYGDNATKGPWGYLGECANPTSLAAVTNFVTMLMSRYNKAGGAWYDANATTLGKGIQYWETWNEPTNTDSNGNTTGAGTVGAGFWWGTPAQMVDFAQTQYAAVKVADSSVLVTTPGFSEDIPFFPATFLSTTGLATGKTGAQSCDAYAWHTYRLTPPGVTFGSFAQDLLYASQGAVTVQSWLTANGYGALPLWIGEWGVDYSNTSNELAAYYAAPANFRYNWTARTLMLLAAYGVKNVCPWNWSENGPIGNSGNWEQDTQGVQLAWNDAKTKMVGKTITSRSFVLNGPVNLGFSDGTSWTV